MAYLLLFLYAHCSWLLGATGTVVAALLLGIPVRRLSFGAGPAWLTVNVLEVDVVFSIVPVDISVTVGVPQDDELPDDETTIGKLHPLARAFFRLAGPLAVLGTVLLVAGFSQTIDYFSAIYSGAWSVVAWQKSIRQIGASVLNFVSSTSIVNGMTGVMASCAGFSLLPIPILPAGSALLDMIGTIIDVGDDWRQRILLAGFLFVCTIALTLWFGLIFPDFSG